MNVKPHPPSLKPIPPQSGRKKKLKASRQQQKQQRLEARLLELARGNAGDKTTAVKLIRQLQQTTNSQSPQQRQKQQQQQQQQQPIRQPLKLTKRGLKLGVGERS